MLLSLGIDGYHIT